MTLTMTAVPKRSCMQYVCMWLPSAGVDALPVDLQRFVTGLREVDKETRGEETVVSIDKGSRVRLVTSSRAAG